MWYGSLCHYVRSLSPVALLPRFSTPLFALKMLCYLHPHNDYLCPVVTFPDGSAYLSHTSYSSYYSCTIMNRIRTNTSLMSSRYFSRTAFVLCFLVLLAGCKSLETRLQEAETEGRLDEAFRLSVEYYDDNKDKPEARTALERVGNARLNSLISTAERAMSNDNFTETISLLYEHSTNSATAVIRTAELRGVQLAKRNMPETMRTGVYTALETYYQRGLGLIARSDWTAALAHFKKMAGLKDADRYIAQAQREIQYANALAEFNAENYRTAYAEFGKLDAGFKDVAQMRAKSLELGKFTVAVFGFTGDRDNLIRERITQKLMQDIFIEVINADNLAKLSRVSPGSQNNDVRYVINGSAALTLSPVCAETINPDVEAWIVTDKYREVDSGVRGKRFVRVAYPLDFLQQRLSVSGAMNARYDITDARKFTTLATDRVEQSYEDAIIQWTYKGSHDPERFTLRNPLRDTLTAYSAWKFNYNDETFQEHFIRQQQLIGPQEIASLLFRTVADKTADAVIQTIYRLEEKHLSVSR